MKHMIRWAVVMGALALCASTYEATVVQATPQSGFSGTTIALGRFDAFEVFNKSFLPGTSGSKFKDLWFSFQKTKGPSDLYVQNNTWAPGGTTGWHSHPGHSLIVVTAGEVTAYEGHDGQCTPHVYTVGEGLVDEGGDHVHVLRNEGSIEAKTVAVQLVPAGATRRIDAAGNPNCPF
jgi:quercetin dioxygenase-like cupin family protein